MGRSTESIRMGVNRTSDRWTRAGKAMRPEDRRRAEDLAHMAKCHSVEAFASFDDPLEAVAFSVLVEMLKRMDAENSPDRRI